MVVTSASESPEERARWAEAERIGRLLRADPLSVSPEYAGDVGFQCVDDLDEEAPDLADRLDLVGRLLRFAVAGAPDAVHGGWWRIELARVLARTALTSAAPGAWDASAYWAGAALDFPHLSIEERDQITVDVAELHCCRVGAVMDAWQSGDLSDQDFLDACGTLLRLLDELGDTTSNPGVRAVIDLIRARTHAYRWDITDEAAELHQAVGLQSWALPVVPDSYPGLADELMLFAELCRSGYQIAPEHVPLALAVNACRRLITLTLVEGEVLPEHHLLLARLLMLREDFDNPAVQNEIVDSLAVAAGMDDEFVWWMYGDALLDRGCEADDVDDIEDALLWLGHSVDRVDSDAEWSWMAGVDIARAHFRLLKITGDLSHVDDVVGHVSRLLDTFDLDAEVVRDLHAWRLFALMDLSDYPDLGASAAQYPVAAWLRESVRVVDGRVKNGLLTDVDSAVALCAALLWITVLSGAADAVVADINELVSALEDSARMLGLAVDHSDLVDEQRTDVTLRVVQELLTNQVNLLRGQTDLDISVASAVLNDAALRQLHDDVAGMTGGLLASAASRLDSLGAFDAGTSLLKQAGPQTSSGVESDQIEALDALFAFFRIGTANGDMQQLRKAISTAHDLMVTTTSRKRWGPWSGLPNSLGGPCPIRTPGRPSFPTARHRLGCDR
ncbi:hypothetical protein [Kutzneria chonburiensis]|uniref:Uncharacterized protein n=1 Tax=Kutzneria chonburiensis TaxID=1483604 RepID=A0ABV6MNZ7_9PSEU|nr:hypothetical protein [Kutzneria chonburiensis]